MIRFADVGNYRGELEIREEDGRYFWRVDCDLEDQGWLEIPRYLYEALVRFHSEREKP